MSFSIQELPSPNFDARPGGVDMLVLHYTGMRSAAEAVARLRDPVAKVSSHYVVDEDGSVLRLVAEARRAYHAGVSFWRGRRALNDVSVGIEIVNPGHEFGYRPFPEPQIASVAALCLEILARHPIPAWNVVGHSDVAPDRKQDPGELFPWRALAARGIGLWPQDTAGDQADPVENAALHAGARTWLGRIGYDVPPVGDGAVPPVVLRAFQRRWRQGTVNGVLDTGTLRRLARVGSLHDRWVD